MFTRIWYNKPLLTLLLTCRIYRICGNSLRDVMLPHTLLMNGMFANYFYCQLLLLVCSKYDLHVTLKKLEFTFFFTITLNCAQAKQYAIGKTFYIINAWATILNFLHHNGSSSLMFHNKHFWTVWLSKLLLLHQFKMCKTIKIKK